MLSRRDKDVVTIKKRELAEVARDSFSAPGLDITNSDIAKDPEFERMVKERLENVGNHPYGDISAQLERSPRAEASSLALLRKVIRRNSPHRR